MEEGMQIEPWSQGKITRGEECRQCPAALVGAGWATLQQQQATKSNRLFWLLAEQHGVALDQGMAGQTMKNQQMWDPVAQFFQPTQPRAERQMATPQQCQARTW